MMETCKALRALGHSRKSPLKAIRERCLDCCAGSSKEVAVCAAQDCPSWPFRRGKNPWIKKRHPTPTQLEALKKSPSTDEEKTQGVEITGRQLQRSA